MKELCQDLAAEGQALDELVSQISDADWNKKTPFCDWTVKDEIAHVAYFDKLARLSASDKAAFDEEMNKIVAHLEDLFRYTREPGLEKSNSELLTWWRAERKGMIAAYEVLDPKTRLPWHLPMSARSSATARIMETWAHGQDVVDALGIKRPATDRLKHIAHLGNVTFGWSFSCRGMEVPDSPVRVELTSPSGKLWTWGPEESGERISGEAEDFCLVVTQRRHYLDTHLSVHGSVAEKWMSIAQVFAGPAAEGPKPRKVEAETAPLP